MGANSGIEWTDATFNPIGGCSIKSPGCAPCYAQKLAGTRLKHHPLYAGTTTKVKGKPVFNGHLTVAADDHPIWSWPARWRGAKEPLLGAGMPSLIFVGDMSDLFHEDRPRAHIDKTVGSIIHSRHIGQLLTKRPEVMAPYFEELKSSVRWFLFDHPIFKKPNFAPEASFEHNVIQRLWLGTSAERQREFDERWPYLRALAAMGFTIFISYEPAIGPLVLPDDFLALGSRAQVIAGGMSGHEATPANPQWFRDVRDQCEAAGVAYFLKQLGEWAPPDRPLKTDEARPEVRAFYNFPSGQQVVRVGKKAAGRLLDGCTHDGMPEART